MPSKKDDNYTYTDYLTWKASERWEIIRGVPYNMSPAPSRRHQEILTNLIGQLYSYFKNKECKVFAAPFDIRLPDLNSKNDIIDTVVQPDISIICDQNKLDDQGCIGAPDLIIEILSPYTAHKDLNEKFNLYENHKVKEYWIVQPGDQTIFIFRHGSNKKYGKPDMYTREDKIKVPLFKGLVLDLSLVFEQEIS